MFGTLPPFLVAITAIMMGIACGMVGMYFRSKRHREEQETLRLALEKGVDLPEDFFRKLERNGASCGSDPLRRGIFWTLIGIALFIALYETAGIDVAVWSGIPLSIGIGCLIYHKLSSQKA